MCKRKRVNGENAAKDRVIVKNLMYLQYIFTVGTTKKAFNLS